MHLEGDRCDEHRGKKKKNESGGKNLGSAPKVRCGGWVWRLVTFDGGDGGGREGRMVAQPVPGRPCVSSPPFSLSGTRSSLSDPRPIRGGHSRASSKPLGYGV